jgi:tricorn protease
MLKGYIRYPSIYQDHIIFVAEDDLWLVSSDGGRAERLTEGVGQASHPRFSPDGQLLAFVGRGEGPREVFFMPALGGAIRRLTFQASSCRVLGWAPDGSEILYASNVGQFLPHLEAIRAVKTQGGLSRELPFGVANAISYGPNGGVVLGRNIGEPANWKRYRGGRVGYLWCDATGSGTFQRLLHLDGNISDPCWVGERIYFLSDHEGVGNIYSCTPDGKDIRCHSTHQDFYARNLSSNGVRLVYHAGADLYLLDPAANSVRLLDVELPSIRTQHHRKFVSAAEYLDTYALHPQGHSLALTTRGKAFSMGNWEGAVIQYGDLDGVRYRFLEWFNNHKYLVAISDASGHEAPVIFYPPEEARDPRVLVDIEFGRVRELKVSPTDDFIAITNHRNELVVVDLTNETVRVLDYSEYGHIRHMCWSPDGCWLAYSVPISSQKVAIKLANLESGKTYQVTNPVLQDTHPAFDPEGNYLYFIGQRTFNPVYDSLRFGLSFPRSTKPYVILLRRDQHSPFIPDPKVFNDKKQEQDKAARKSNNAKDEETAEAEREITKLAPISIDLDDIAERVLPFPVSEGRYYAIGGIKGKALFLAFPVDGSVSNARDQPRGSVDSYDFEGCKTERLIDGVNDFDLSRDGKTLIYWGKEGLRVLKAGEKASKLEKSDKASRESGWLDLQRVKIAVWPAAEWKQMFAEAWRLQREQFWSEDMAGVDWEAIYAKYTPLIERVSSRAELSDLLWEMQGELGTSHAYERGGDYRRDSYYRQGFLGIDWVYDRENNRYRVAHVVKGDTADARATSPLTGPGLDITEGDAVLAINGQYVSPSRIPQELLVNQAGNEVQLTVEDAETKKTHVVTVKTLYSDFPPRYRDWVERNRRIVHECSEGRLGYIHIPDMKERGYGEFCRAYLAEYDRQGLIIDVRWNTGGNVSPLVLAMLMRKRIGYQYSRWRQPRPYPYEASQGPLVVLCNEWTASDGETFCQGIREMQLGPLIGTRTWGGTIYILPYHDLADGTETTQPEYPMWFKAVGWGIENHGIDPDIEVEITPQDYANKVDLQLERAIVEAYRQIQMYSGLGPQLDSK